MRPLQQIVRRQLEYVHACTLETSATVLRPIAAIGQKESFNSLFFRETKQGRF